MNCIKCNSRDTELVVNYWKCYSCGYYWKDYLVKKPNKPHSLRFFQGLAWRKRPKLTIEELGPSIIKMHPNKIHYDRPSFWKELKDKIRGLQPKVSDE